MEFDTLARQTRFGYDASGRMISRTLPLGQMETTQYDRAGNVISTVGFRGNTISHGYDGAGKLVEKRRNDGLANGWLEQLFLLRRFVRFVC
jgi:YD repeat-containing protein